MRAHRILTLLFMATFLTFLSGTTHADSPSLAAAPPAPLWVIASDGSYSDHVHIFWPASAGATYYQVSRAPDLVSTMMIFSTPQDVSAYDTTITRCQVFYYRVRACAGSNCSAWTSADSGWRAVAPPTGISASDSFTNRVRVTWNLSSGATYYELVRWIPGSEMRWNNLLTTAYDDYSASPGVQYNYGAQACCALGCSGVNASVVGVRAMTPPTVQASKGVFADKVRVTWTASANATRYIVHRGPSLWPDREWEVASVTAFDDTSAETGRAYNYWVQACRHSVCSEKSNPNSGYRPQAAPTNVQASDGAFPDRVQITWSPSPHATGYKVFRNTTNNTATATQIGAASVTLFDDFTAASNTRYNYWVIAYGNVGESPYSGTNIGYRPLPAPTHVQASDGAFSDKVRVTWNAVSGAWAYKVYRHTVNNAGAASLLGATTSTSVDDTTPAPGATYYYWVRGYGDTGDGVLSTSDAGYRQSAGTPTPTPTRTPTVTATRTATRTPTVAATSTRDPRMALSVCLPMVVK